MPIEYSKDAELDIKPLNGKRSKKEFNLQTQQGSQNMQTRNSKLGLL